MELLLGGESVRLTTVPCRPDKSTSPNVSCSLQAIPVSKRLLLYHCIPRKVGGVMAGQEDTQRRHPHHALTHRAVEALKGTGRARKIADGGGLYVVVAPNGAKSWMLRTV